ncbi:MAG: DUF1735 domain-containing protein [Bacteroidota bacterium]
MNKFIKMLFAGLFIVSLVSCLKDKEYEDGLIGHDLTGVPKVIELAVNFDPSHSRSLALDFKDSSLALAVLTVRLAAAEVAQEDITVTIDTSTSVALINAYNTENGTAVVRMPQSLFTIEGGLSVVIPKGQRETSVKIRTNAIAFDPSTTYGLAFRIASVTPAGYTISQNYGTYVTTIGAKNKYDGVYTMNSYHNRPGYQLLVADEEMHMITTGANDVIFYWPQAGSVGHPIMTSTGLSWYGATVAPTVRFDPVSNLVTNVFNASAAGPPISVYSGPLSGQGRYDEATKKMYVYFRYNANNERAFMDTLTYVGPR